MATGFAKTPAGGRCGPRQVRCSTGQITVGGFESTTHVRVVNIDVGTHPGTDSGLRSEPRLEEPDLLVGVGREVRGDGSLLVGQGPV